MKHKRHGLWSWHRAVNSRKEKIEWWKGKDQLIAAQNALHYRFSSERISDAKIAVRCANRYFRLHKIRPTVEQWNDLTFLIGVINECIKNKGNNEIYRGLAKHLARNP